MTYQAVEPDDPIRQGDIFIGVPRVVLSLTELLTYQGGHGLDTVLPWSDIAQESDPVLAVLALKSVAAIVISQNCDASRAPNLTLCEIRPFQNVEGKCRDTTKPESWVSIITQQARLNQKWFYLPPSLEAGFDVKMGVDFQVTLCLPRTDIEAHIHLRRCRLNELALAHFRERIAEFFRRYPYDEWYPLNDEEFAAYQKQYPEAEPFPWQMRTHNPESDSNRT